MVVITKRLLFTTKLRCLQKNKSGHTNVGLVIYPVDQIGISVEEGRF